MSDVFKVFFPRPRGSIMWNGRETDGGQQFYYGSLGPRALATGGDSLLPGSYFFFLMLLARATAGWLAVKGRAAFQLKAVAALATVILRATQMDLNTRVKLKSEDISLFPLSFLPLPPARVI